MKDKPTLSFVLINYNSFSYVQKLMKKIESEIKRFSYELIIINNDPSNPVCSKLDSDPERVICVENKQNEGFGKASNQAFALSKADLVLFINPDISWKEGTIESCVDFLGRPENHGFGVVGCPTVNAHGREIISFLDEDDHRSFFSVLRYSLRNNLLVRKGVLTFLRSKKERQADVLYGHFLMFRREAFAGSRGFDPDFFLYYEELELFRNRFKEDNKVAINRDGLVMHEGGVTAERKMLHKQNELSMYLYWYKMGYMPFFAFIIGDFLNLITILFFLLLMKKENRMREWRRVKLKWELMPGLLFEIMRYPNKYGSRPDGLRIKEWRNE